MRLPLFPLHTVLYPYLPLPLHIFEERYRAMVRDLLADGSPFGRQFVVALISEGPEVGSSPTGPPAHHAVGTVAAIRRAEPLPNGRWALVTVGTARVAIGAVDHAGEYSIADVRELGEPVGEVPSAGGMPRLLASVQDALDGYLASVKRFATVTASKGEAMDEVLKPIRLPDDPVAASYAVAGLIQIELVRKQQLLELPDAASRLRAGRALLRREARLLADGALPPVVAGDLGYNPN